eukprot:jgi/Chrzof1/5243/Cz15g18160.t1
MDVQHGSTPSAPSLKDCCTYALIRYRHCLGDVGWVETEALKQILSHCSVDELTTIEDSTRQGSNRDLSWHTWHLWHNLYKEKYGPVPQGIGLPKLRGHRPQDYTEPSIDAPRADYRQLFEDKKAEVAAKMNRSTFKLRALYAAETRTKQYKQVEYTTKQPPAKRQRTSESGVERRPVSTSGPTPGASLLGKARDKFLRDMGRKSAKPLTASGSQPSRSRTFVKPVAPAGQAAVRSSVSPKSQQPQPRGSSPAALTAAHVRAVSNDVHKRGAPSSTAPRTVRQSPGKVLVRGHTPGKAYAGARSAGKRSIGDHVQRVDGIKRDTSRSNGQVGKLHAGPATSKRPATLLDPPMVLKQRVRPSAKPPSGLLDNPVSLRMSSGRG